MDTCITVWHWPNHDRWYDEGIRESLNLIKEAGFTHINWNPDSGNSYLLSKAEIGFTRVLISQAGLRAHSVHASNGRNRVTELAPSDRQPVARETRKDILSPHEWQRQSGVELLKNRIDLAAELGAPNVVLHIDITDSTFKNPESEAAFCTPMYRSLDELQSYCADRDVQIAVETLFCAGAESFLTLYDRLFARYPAEFIGICFDCGHWELIEPGKLTVLDRYGDRLIATHIHDNFGAKDDHLLPFDGRLNWDAITAAIAATSYKTPLNLETPMDRYAAPPADFYRRAHAVAARLETMVARNRRKDAE